MEMMAYETPQTLPCFVLSLSPQCLILTKLLKLQWPSEGEERGEQSVQASGCFWFELSFFLRP